MATPNNEGIKATSTNELREQALKNDAKRLFKANNPAEEVVAGKIRRIQGRISGVYVLWPMSALSGKEPKFDQTEINNIGKVFGQIQKQPTFTFMGDKYQAKKEKCISQEPHMQGAVCFSGAKLTSDTKDKGIYAMMTRDGYVIIVKTKSFNTTRAAVEGGKGLAHNVQNAAMSYVSARK